MPYYSFQNIKTKETKEFFFHMNDKKEVDGWIRLWTNPNASIDSQINPLSAKEFSEKTKNKNYNLGQLFDKSAELSEKRKKICGKDFEKERAQKEYEKKTGAKHPHRDKPTTFYI